MNWRPHCGREAGEVLAGLMFDACWAHGYLVMYDGDIETDIGPQDKSGPGDLAMVVEGMFGYHQLDEDDYEAALKSYMFALGDDFEFGAV